MILRSLLGDRSEGFYIDIGAHHPIYYSNTYHFYLKEWSGLNIDALPGSMELFRKLRPRDINIEACISNQDGDNVTFFQFSKPAINSFDPNYAEELINKGEVLVGKSQLRTKTLKAILSENNLSSKKIDFMTIDIEGVDSIVLKSLDFNLIRPRIIVFEDHRYNLMKPEDSELLRFLIENKYQLVAKTGPSLIAKDVLDNTQ
ncbi:MAG: hypothetical protein Fur0010_02070 [Bdellovibrio sp.]